MSLFHKIKWWFLHRLVPEHRYHVVPTGLSPGYVDIYVRMAHAIFELLLIHKDTTHGTLSKEIILAIKFWDECYIKEQFPKLPFHVDKIDYFENEDFMKELCHHLQNICKYDVFATIWD